MFSYIGETKVNNIIRVRVPTALRDEVVDSQTGVCRRDFTVDYVLGLPVPGLSTTDPLSTQTPTPLSIAGAIFLYVRKLLMLT